MREIIVFGLVVLAALAVLAAPVPAAPVQSVIWKGAAVSIDDPASDGEIVGAQLRFDGAAVQQAGGLWSGSGTIVDRKGRFRADLVINDVYSPSDHEVYICGEEATVIDHGVQYQCPSFGVLFDTSTGDWRMYVEQNLESSWVWCIAGTGFRGKVRIT